MSATPRGRWWARLGLVAGVALAAGCGVGPDYQRPALSPASGYAPDATAGDTSVATRTAGSVHLHSGEDIPEQWWQVFHCAELDGLVAEALQRNPSITAAAAALRSAHELVIAQRGGYYPQVSAGISPSRQKVAPTLSSPLANGENIYNLTTTQVSVSYAPDFFGANARAVESLVAQEDLQHYQLAAARLTLASNLVLSAIQDAMLREQIATTRAILAEQGKITASFQRLHDLGQASVSDVAAQEAQLAQVEATLPGLERQYLINRDLICALLGRTPGEVVAASFTVTDLRTPSEVPLSLPARLVEQRPDVLIAEAQLRAASAQVGIAEAARWPSLVLSANIGSDALTLYPEFSTPTHFFDIAASLTQPLFDAGTLKHRERAAEAAYQQAAASYQVTVIGAFQNTSDVLHALAMDTEALADARRSQELAAKSLDILRRQLALGDVNQQAVLIADQAALQTTISLLQAQATLSGDVVALYQALGGGWWHHASDSTAPPKGQP